jgi:hypothetical protein
MPHRKSTDIWIEMSSPSSGLRTKPRKKPAWNSKQRAYLLGLPFDPVDKLDMLLRNVGWLPDYMALSPTRTLHNHRCENLRSYTALYPRRQNSSQPRLWEPQILHFAIYQKTELFTTTAVRTWNPYPRRQNSPQPQLWEPRILHGVISQKMELFITTAVRTSDPTRRYIPEDRTLHNHRCEKLKSLSQKTELSTITAVRTSDPTRRYIPEDRTLHTHCCENLRFNTKLQMISVDRRGFFSERYKSQVQRMMSGFNFIFLCHSVQNVCLLIGLLFESV